MATTISPRISCTLFSHESTEDRKAVSLSLFIVPKTLSDNGHDAQRNDVVCVGLNHKMGFRGTSNAVLSFGDGEYQPDGRPPGAVGYLVGEAGRGLSYMFHMMNESRIGVGACATALGYTGYLHALDYARTREQGRRLTDDGDDEARFRLSSTQT